MEIDSSPERVPFNEEMDGVGYSDCFRAIDDRGKFLNISLDMIYGGCERSYVIENNSRGVIRAFHGHKREGKVFLALRGSFKFVVMDMAKKRFKTYVVSSDAPRALVVQPGFYNGFVSLKDDSILVCFSSSSMEDSVKDDFRLPYDFLGKEIWEVEHR